MVLIYKKVYGPFLSFLLLSSPLYFCLLVGVLAEIGNNYLIGYQETWWKDEVWVSEEPSNFL